MKFLKVGLLACPHCLMTLVMRVPSLRHVCPPHCSRCKTAHIASAFVSLFWKKAKILFVFLLFISHLPKSSFNVHQQTKCKVEPRTWSSLGRILCGILMADPKDYGICQLCLDVAERFFFLTPTVNSVFLTVCSHLFIIISNFMGFLSTQEQLKSLELCKELRLWHFIFAGLHSPIQSIYSLFIACMFSRPSNSTLASIASEVVHERHS